LICFAETVSLLHANWLSDRIQLDPAVCHGKPVVRGTRVFVANVGAPLPRDNRMRNFAVSLAGRGRYPGVLGICGGLTAMETAEA